MRVGLIDVDSHNWPNLALMKLSAMAAWNTRGGKLLVLPCMVGDTVYYLNGTSERDFPWQITEVSVYGREPEKIIFRVGHEGTEDYAAFAADELGERWFLDRAEAVEAIKRKRGDDGLP